MIRFKAFAVLSVVFLCGLSACSSNKKESSPTPGQQVSAQQEPAWKLQLMGSCESATPDQCLAGHGFQVTAEGDFRVGPGPQGQLMTGQLSTEEFKDIEGIVMKLQLWSPVMDALASDCVARDVDSVAMTVRYNRAGWAGQLLDVVRTGTGQICYKGASEEDSSELMRRLAALARKYYPVPFPDACTDSVMVLEQLHTTVRGCSTDNDCSYVDNTYLPVPEGDLQFVIVDDCSITKTLPVANASLLAERQLEFLAARNTARTLCGNRIVRSGCSVIRGFQSTGPRAECRQHECRIGQSVEIN